MSVEPTYFATALAFREWLAEHAESSTSLVVGFMKKGSGTPSLTWPEAVDEALCVGWIDGVRRRLDDARYTIRFTPRKPRSHWSAVNIARMAVLAAEGRLTPAGRAAFAQRTEARSRRASYEQATPPELSPAELRQLQRHVAAWSFFESQPPSYRRKAIWVVISAKKETTRQSRLAALIEACAQGQRT